MTTARTGDRPRADTWNNCRPVYMGRGWIEPSAGGDRTNRVETTDSRATTANFAGKRI